MANLPLLSGLALLLVSYLVTRFLFTKKKLPLPPGPKGFPLVGNIADLPPKGCLEWQHWLEHKDLYGPISCVTVFGQTIVLVHDLDMATELLDRRGAKYSSRSRMVFAGEMSVPVNSSPFSASANRTVLFVGAVITSVCPFNRTIKPSANSANWPVRKLGRMLLLKSFIPQWIWKYGVSYYEPWKSRNQSLAILKRESFFPVVIGAPPA